MTEPAQSFVSHHRAKDTARAETMTLENCLRGTGDLGAVASAVYGVRCEPFAGDAAYLKESRKLVRLEAMSSKRALSNSG